MNDQIEIKDHVKLLNEDGSLAVKGWARRNVFEYDRRLTKPRSRLKEWDFYQISDGEYMVQLSFFNITVASCASACIVDLRTGKRIVSSSLHLFTRKRFILPRVSDLPNFFRYESNGTVLQFDTRRNCKKLEFKGKAKGRPFKMNFTLDLLPDCENITIVTPFKDMPTRFFMTTKHNCMPCSGKVTWGNGTVHEFKKDKTFAVLDWGRGVWPHSNMWYWGNGAQRIKDADGNEHIFGFEITWKIGDESNATETCLFWDGKAHKIGAVDVEKFPGEHNGWTQPWHFVSEDGRFDFTMRPFFDNATGAIVFDLGMKTHQVHGLWDGYAVLDDGTRVDIKNMYAFCEYVVNKW